MIDSQHLPRAYLLLARAERFDIGYSKVPARLAEILTHIMQQLLQHLLPQWGCGLVRP